MDHHAIADPKIDDITKEHPEHGRWSFPWRSEDDWVPITAAVVLLIVLSVLIYSGLTV